MDPFFIVKRDGGPRPVVSLQDGSIPPGPCALTPCAGGRGGPRGPDPDPGPPPLPRLRGARAAV